MKPFFIILILLLFVVGCVPKTDSSDSSNIETNEPVDEKETTSAVKPTSANAVVECIDDNAPSTERGKVTLVYGNEQRESKSDACVENDDPLFKAFKTVYYCEGLEVKSKVFRCMNNQTCDKGSCITP